VTVPRGGHDTQVNCAPMRRLALVAHPLARGTYAEACFSRVFPTPQSALRLPSSRHGSRGATFFTETDTAPDFVDYALGGAVAWNPSRNLRNRR
jgi:hypothetical protein